jgi:hypothetical protein
MTNPSSGSARSRVVDIRGHEEHRELLFQALGGTYALQYPYDGGSILMLRVFHGREAREGRDPSTHAARRRRSICRSHSFSWFDTSTDTLRPENPV